jgi:hypothetical protein
MTDFAQVYASAPDALLIDLHQDLDSLESEARSALLAEIARRGDAVTMAAINANLAALVKPPARGFWLNLLAFILIVFPFLSGLIVFGKRATQERDVPALAENSQWQTYGTELGLLWLLCAVACVLSGAAILRGGQSTPRLVIWVLWLTGPGAKLLAPAIVYLIWGARAVDTGAAAGFVIGSAVFALLWTLYLLRSKHVEAYFNQKNKVAST